MRAVKILFHDGVFTRFITDRFKACGLREPTIRDMEFGYMAL